jgi:hypothetical protein
MVSSSRDIDIEWKQFSLALKNGSLEGKDKTEGAEAHASAHKIHRVILAAGKQGASTIDLYTTFGIAYHLGGEDFNEDLIKDVLVQKNLPAELAKAANDESLDKELQSFIDEATAVAGQDIGTPTIIFILKDGSKNGFFGPVLQELPDMEEALRLWDGLSMLATDKNFYELKRTRPSGGPDVYSTAKC